MGLILPQPGFLRGLRELCSKYGALLVFDEVITGFRLSYGGAQGRFDIMPDLTTFGKIIGGGLPVGAYGGRADLMRHIAPEGEVYQAGTLSGNPLAMAAGLATLNILKARRLRRSGSPCACVRGGTSGDTQREGRAGADSAHCLAVHRVFHGSASHGLCKRADHGSETFRDLL